MNKFTITDIMRFFNDGLPADHPANKPARFASEWKALTETEKAQIRSGLENGSLSY